MPHTIDVTLGGRTYAVAERRTRENEAFRQRLQGPIDDLAARVEGLRDVDITSTASVGGLIRQIGAALLRGPDLVRELLYEYAPEIAADREFLEAEAYDSEFHAAFMKVVTELVYPFGSLTQRAGKLIALFGSESEPTNPSWPSASGAAGTTNSTRSPSSNSGMPTSGARGGRRKRSR